MAWIPCMITGCSRSNDGRGLCANHRKLVATAGQLHRFPTRAEIKVGAEPSAPMTEDELHALLNQPAL